MFLKQKLLNLFMSTKDYLKRVGKNKTTNPDGISAEYMGLSPRNPAHYKSRMPGAVSRLAQYQRIPIKVKPSMPYVRLGIPELFREEKLECMAKSDALRAEKKDIPTRISLNNFHNLFMELPSLAANYLLFGLVLRNYKSSRSSTNQSL